MTQAESLIDLFMTPGRRGALEAALESGRTASVYNLAGSSVTMRMTRVICVTICRVWRARMP